MRIRLLGLSWLLLAVALGVRGQSAVWAFGVDFYVLPRPDAGDREEGSSDPASGIEKGHCVVWPPGGPCTLGQGVHAVGTFPVFCRPVCLLPRLELY